MVRLMCQNCPRSCCDEGERVDQVRAIQAVSALVKPEEKMSYLTILNESENSTDSFSSQEVTSTSEGGVDTDTDGEHLYIVEEDTNGNDVQNDKNQAVENRRQRRRERNRKSAQAYRQRRRQQTQKSDEILHELMEKNHLLREKMSKLEEEKAIILNILKTKIKIPWPYPVFMPYPCPTGVWSSQDVTVSTPIGMDSVVPEVIVAS